MDLTPEMLSAQFDRASRGCHAGAVKGFLRGAQARELTAKKYCSPGESPFDPMVFPSKRGRSGAPFDIGNLRRHMYSKVLDEGGNISGIVGNTSDYAGPVHEGTKGRERGSVSAGGISHDLGATPGLRPRPFIRRAIEDEMSDTLRIIQEETWRGISDGVLR